METWNINSKCQSSKDDYALMLAIPGTIRFCLVDKAGACVGVHRESTLGGGPRGKLTSKGSVETQEATKGNEKEAPKTYPIVPEAEPWIRWLKG